MRIKNEFTACTDFPLALGCERESGQGWVLGFNSTGDTSCLDSKYPEVSSFRRCVATTVAGKLRGKGYRRRRDEKNDLPTDG